jgi:hypothetical protein
MSTGNSSMYCEQRKKDCSLKHSDFILTKGFFRTVCYLKQINAIQSLNHTKVVVLIPLVSLANT